MESEARRLRGPADVDVQALDDRVAELEAKAKLHQKAGTGPYGIAYDDKPSTPTPRRPSASEARRKAEERRRRMREYEDRRYGS